MHKRFIQFDCNLIDSFNEMHFVNAVHDFNIIVSTDLNIDNIDILWKNK